MNIVLFDDENVWKNLLPFTFTRPVCEIRFGVFTLREKWENSLKKNCSYYTRAYLQKKFPQKLETANLFINGSVCPNEALLQEIEKLGSNEAIFSKHTLLAFKGSFENFKHPKKNKTKEFAGEITQLNQVWDIFQKLGKGIEADVAWIRGQRKTKKLSNTVTVIGDKKLVFLEEGAKAEACILNTTAGSIYIGKDAEVMEGSVVRGPFALGEHSALKLSAKIYGPSSIGPHSKVGGELNNSVIFGYSNKAHDGFLGNSVIGEWCNLGADTNNSNLKNNYGNVKLYNYAQKKQVDTGLQFCGLMMGDHSKAGINTMFNTGTVVGVGANIFGGGFPPTHIPSFSWGGSQGFESYRLEKLFETAEKVFERRGLVFGENDKHILKKIKETTKD